MVGVLCLFVVVIIVVGVGLGYCQGQVVGLQVVGVCSNVYVDVVGGVGEGIVG